MTDTQMDLLRSLKLFKMGINHNSINSDNEYQSPPSLHVGISIVPEFLTGEFLRRFFVTLYVLINALYGIYRFSAPRLFDDCQRRRNRRKNERDAESGKREKTDDDSSESGSDRQRKRRRKTKERKNKSAKK